MISLPSPFVHALRHLRTGFYFFIEGWILIRDLVKFRMFCYLDYDSDDVRDLIINEFMAVMYQEVRGSELNLY